MWEWIAALTGGLRTLPQTLRQSIGNPTQADRLPDTSRMTIRFPVIDSREVYDNSRLWQILIWLTTFVGLWLMLTVLFHWQVPLVTSTRMEIVPFFLGTLTFAFFYFALGPSWQHWFGFVAVCSLLFLLVLLREPYLMLLLTTVGMALTSDRIATHTLLIETCAPLAHPEARRLTAAWRKRWRGLGQVAGAEFYPLMVLVAPLGTVWLFYWELQRGAVSWEDNTMRFGIVCLTMLLSMVGLEYLAAFLWQRTPRKIRTLLKAMKMALVDWCTYDRGNSISPGVHKSPCGSCWHRWVLLGSLLLAMLGLSSIYIRPGLHNTTWGALDLPVRAFLRASYGSTPGQLPHFEMATASEQMRKAVLSNAMQGTLYARIGDAIERSSASQGAQWQMQAGLGIGVRLLILLLMGGVTLFYTLAGCGVASASVAGRKERYSPEKLLSPHDWRKILEQLQVSADATERESLFLGVNASDNAPVLIPQGILKDHAHILGDTGSGKTSMGIASIVTQLLRMGDCSVVILDLKGDDHSLFEGVRLDSAAAGLPFRWYTNKIGYSSYAFNPLKQEYLRDLPNTMKAEIITNALGLQYGRDYARAFFSDSNQELAARAFSEVGDVSSFRRLEPVLTNRPAGASKKLLEDASHIRRLVPRLADSHALNVSDASDASQSVVDAAIDFADVFRRPQAIHFHLSSGYGTGTAAEVARLAFYSLLHGGYHVPPSERIQTFVVIDEFQRLISGNLKMIMQLARSLNIGVILANQSLSDLKEGGVDISAAVQTNTRMRQVFAASYLYDQEELSRASGETVHLRGSWFSNLITGHDLSSIHMTESISPRLRMNDLLLATDKEGASVLQIRSGKGYSQFGGLSFVMQSGYTIDAKEYERRKQVPWPELSEETLSEGYRERVYQDDPQLPPLGTPRDDLFLNDPLLSESDELLDPSDS